MSVLGFESCEKSFNSGALNTVATLVQRIRQFLNENDVYVSASYLLGTKAQQ